MDADTYDEIQAEMAELRAEIERLQCLVAELRDGNERLRSQNYCTVCGSILSGSDVQSATAEHKWFKPTNIKWECCEVCGIVRRMDGIPNKPCPGPVRVGPRRG